MLKDGKDLLQEKSRTRFFQKFPLVSQRLGESLSQLSLVTEAIDSLDEEATQCELLTGLYVIFRFVTLSSIF